MNSVWFSLQTAIASLTALTGKYFNEDEVCFLGGRNQILDSI